MIKIKIINKEGKELFSAKDVAIDVVYNGSYCEGDKIVISKTDTEYLALQLDDTLAESIVFAPILSLE